MTKRERLLKIANLVNQKSFVTIAEIMEEFDISDMTARRDLDELESLGKLTRIHGGAQSLTSSLDRELSHSEKTNVQIEEKKEIVKYVASHIQSGETVFLGPGTTIQMLAEELIGKDIRVVTTSLPVFYLLVNRAPTEVFLVGGEYRPNTGTFVGTITNQTLKMLKFNKSFISCNGIHNSEITTYSLEEGEEQKIALDNSKERFLLADNKKFNKSDFYIYYSLNNFDAVITDSAISNDVLEYYSKYTRIIKVDNIDID